MRTLCGIDPGSNEGAAVALVPEAPGVYRASVVTWHKTRRKADPYDVVLWFGGRMQRERAESLDRALAFVSALPPVHALAIEWPEYKMRGRGRSPKSMVALAYSAGVAAAWVPTTATPERVTCGEWRERVLRIPGNTAGDRAKARAIEAVTGRTERHKRPVGWRIVWPDGIEITSHVAEAACVAMWPQGVDHG